MTATHNDVANVAAAQQFSIQPQTQHPDNNHARKVTVILGILNVVIGVLFVIFGSVATGKHENDANLRHWVSDIAVGIWSGMWITCAGMLGIFGGKKRQSALIGISMGFNICSSFICGLNIIFFSLALAYYRKYIKKKYPGNCWYSDGNYNYYRDQKCISAARNEAKAYTAIYSLLIILTVAEMVISIVAATYASKAFPCACCCYPVQPTQVVMFTPDGGSTLIPVDANGRLYLQPGVPGTVQSTAGYPNQVGSSSGALSNQAPAVTYTTGIQSTIIPQPTTVQTGAVGGPLEAPPLYTEKAPTSQLP